MRAHVGISISSMLLAAGLSACASGDTSDKDAASKTLVVYRLSGVSPAGSIT
jgi:hypothetical protein